MEYLCKIKVARATLQEIADILDKEEMDPTGEDILYSVTADFPNGYSADIKVCNGEPAYVDPVLFDARGCEVAVMEPFAMRLEGTYTWDLGADKYTAVIEPSDKQQSFSF